MTGKKELVYYKLFGEVYVAIGPGLTDKEIEALPDDQRENAKRNRTIARNLEKQNEMTAFYVSIKHLFAKKNYDAICCKIINTDFQANDKLTKFVEMVVKLRLLEPVCDPQNLQTIINALNKLRCSIEDACWSEQLKIRFSFPSEMLKIVKILVQNNLEDTAIAALEKFENEHSLCIESLQALCILNAPIPERYLYWADSMLKLGKIEEAINAYEIIYKETGSLKTVDGKDRQLVLSAYNPEDRKWTKNVKKAAEKAGIILKEDKPSKIELIRKKISEFLKELTYFELRNG